MNTVKNLNDRLRTTIALWLAHFTRTHGKLYHHNMFPAWEYKIGPLTLFTQSDWQGFNAYVEVELGESYWSLNIPD